PRAALSTDRARRERPPPTIRGGTRRLELCRSCGAFQPHSIWVFSVHFNYYRQINLDEAVGECPKSRLRPAHPACGGSQDRFAAERSRRIPARRAALLQPLVTGGRQVAVLSPDVLFHIHRCVGAAQKAVRGSSIF